MFASDNVIQRVKIEVDLTLSDERQFKGFVFISPQQRLVDLLNDTRAFIPFQLEDETVMIISKTQIGTMIPAQQDSDKEREEQITKWQSTFARASMESEEAYKILGLQPGATKEEIQKAKKRLLSGLHPDTGGSTYLAAKINQAVNVVSDY